MSRWLFSPSLLSLQGITGQKLQREWFRGPSGELASQPCWLAVSVPPSSCEPQLWARWGPGGKLEGPGGCEGLVQGQRTRGIESLSQAQSAPSPGPDVQEVGEEWGEKDLVQCLVTKATGQVLPYTCRSHFSGLVTVTLRLSKPSSKTLVSPPQSEDPQEESSQDRRGHEGH